MWNSIGAVVGVITAVVGLVWYFAGQHAKLEDLENTVATQAAKIVTLTNIAETNSDRVEKLIAQVGTLSEEAVQKEIKIRLEALKFDARVLPDRTVILSFADSCPEGFTDLGRVAMNFKDFRARDILRPLGIYEAFNKDDVGGQFGYSINDYDTIRVRPCMRA